MAGAPADADAGQLAVMAVPGVRQAEHDASVRKIEDFDAARARANYVILTSIQQQDVMALFLLTLPSEKWNKLRHDYAAVSA